VCGVLVMAIASSDLYIKTNRLAEINDLVRIEEDLHAGYVVFLNTNDFFEKFDQDLVQLKQTIDRLNNICIKQGGQIARVGADILVLTPSADVTFYQ
jgi:SepF-like predicted cell division protein (DUF552 family)